MDPFLDFHTHAQGCKKYLTHSDVLVVQSLHLGEKLEPRADFATWGVHPMLEGAREFVDRLQHHPNELLADWTHTLTSTPAIIGIGECGWDHRSPLTLQEQETLIHFHITLAELLHYPLVFHVVGGWHHLLATKKSHPTSRVPWIVHGFRGHSTLAQQLTNAGIYLSLHPYCPKLQVANYFLETDDTPDLIETHYKAREILQKDQRKHIINLFCSLFPMVSQLIRVDL